MTEYEDVLDDPGTVTPWDWNPYTENEDSEQIRLELMHACAFGWGGLEPMALGPLLSQVAILIDGWTDRTPEGWEALREQIDALCVPVIGKRWLRRRCGDAWWNEPADAEIVG